MLRLPLRSALLLSLATALSAPLVAVTNASAATVLSAHVQFPSSLMSTVPLARLHFNGPVDASKLPPIVTSPALVTKWEQIGPNDVRAVTSTPLIPSTNYLIGVAAKVSCTDRCVSVARVARTVKAGGSELWLEQLLASQNYLPVAFRSADGDPSALRPGPGTFTWRFAALPASLKAQWRQGLGGVLVTGAIMRFQDEHGLATTGSANGATWSALLKAAAAGQHNRAPYNYVDVSLREPQSLTLYVNGVPSFHTTVNLGIAQSPTAPGTYPVYLRFTSTTMSGTNPDGSKYHDTGIPWVSYFHGGDALHGFIRYSYGSPQSLGCVEMRFSDAKVIWPSTPIGTLVTVH